MFSWPVLPQPMLCCVTTHLSGMFEVELERLSTTFTLNHPCSRCRFRPPSKLLSSQPSHKSLPPCHAPSAHRTPLAPGIVLELTDHKIGHCSHEIQGSKRIISVGCNQIFLLQGQFWGDFFLTAAQVDFMVQSLVDVLSSLWMKKGSRCCNLLDCQSFIFTLNQKCLH